MKEQDQTIRSLPDGRRRITEAYRLFEAYIQQIRTVESCRLPWATIASMATNPVEDGSDDQAKLAKQIRTDARTKLASALKRMKQLHEKLPEAFAPVLPMLRYSRVPLGKFHFEGVGRSEDGNHAYYFFTQLYHRAYDWALNVDRVLSTDLQLPLDPREWDYLSKIDDNLPLGNGREKSIRDRLDLEESQLLRDLPKYAEILGVKEKNPETVFGIVQEIERSYDLAFSVVSRLRYTETFATQAAELTAIAFFEGEDEEQRIAEAIARAKGRLFDRRSDLQDRCSLIDSDLEELAEAFRGVTYEVFGFSYADLKDFEATGDPSVYASITNLAYLVKRWISKTLGFLSLVEQLPVKLDLSLRQKCNDLADGFPMNPDFESAVRKRILFEKSVLTRNAKAFAESRGIGGSTTVTTPQGRKKSEKALSKAQDQLTLAAATWLHYRDLAAEKGIKLLKRDVFPVAKQLGFKGTYTEFQAKSNDGNKGDYEEMTRRRRKEINFPTEVSFLGDP